MSREILVMDCEERERFWTALKPDFSMLFAPTAERGLGMISEKTALIFLSMGLPDMEGMEALEQINREHRSKPVIVIDPCGTEETCLCMEAFRKGAWDYVKKPLSTEEILQKISLVMEGGSATGTKGDSFAVTDATKAGDYPGIPSHLIGGVLRVRDFVTRNYSESLSLEAACKMASTSKTYFCRFFKSITGHSLRSYQHAVKIRVAEELLKDRRLSVTDVAIMVGYNDSNYFSTIYKKFKGFPPRYQRASCQEAGSSKAVLNKF
jgi:YesN/AraC family two-component response regulator